MIQQTLTLAIASVAKESPSDRAQKAVDALLKSLPKSDGSQALDLNDPNLPRYVELIRDVIKKRKLATIVRATLEERVVPSEAGADWYILDPRVELHDEGRTPQGVPYIRADRIKPGVHVVKGIGVPPFISEDFKKLVEKKKFKGLDDLRLPDKSARKATAWYVAIPLKPIGRGLDHDFFDPAKLKLGAKTAGNWMTDKPGWRTGVERLDAQYAKKKLSFGQKDADALLAMVPLKLLSVSGARRYLRRFLPPGADFAFSWTWEDRQGPQGNLKSSRTLCVSRRAMQALVAAKLVTPREFEPLEIIDQPPRGAKVLDKPGDTGPGPLFAGEWRKRIDAAERQLHTQAKTPSKSSAPPSPAEVLKLLKAARKRDENPLRPGAPASAIDQAQQKLKATLPEFWRKVLAISDGFELPPIEALDGAAVSFDSTRELRGTLQRQMLSLYTEITDQNTEGLIYIGNTIWGDMFYLRAHRRARLKDAPAVLISHETGQDMANWPTAAAMLHELLTSKPSD